MNVQEIESMKPGDTLRDDKVRGLEVRCFSTSTSFYLYYRTRSGATRRPKIGHYPTLTIEVAREIARKWIAIVIMGGDPSHERMRLKAEDTIHGLFQKVWNELWTRTPYIKSGYAGKVLSNYRAHLKPTFGHMRLSEVTPALIREWHTKRAETPYAANRALEVLSRMYKFAEEMGWRDVGTNPCAGVKSFREEKRDRYASPEEVSALWNFLNTTKGNPRRVAFLKLLLFTGSRPTAIERAKWSDLERKQYGPVICGVLRVDGKEGTDKIILPPQALAVIDSLPPSGTDYILGIKFPKHLWAKMLRTTGLKGLWGRDLRRTFATTALSNGEESGVISELLNHRSQQTTKIYAKLSDDKRFEVAVNTANRLSPQK